MNKIAFSFPQSQIHFLIYSIMKFLNNHITVATFRLNASAKYCGISVITMAKTQDLVKFTRNKAYTGRDVRMYLHGIFLAWNKTNKNIFLLVFFSYRQPFSHNSNLLFFLLYSTWTTIIWHLVWLYKADWNRNHVQFYA